MKKKCVRCESLERLQQSKYIYLIKNTLGDTIPLCSTCVVEIREEEDFFVKNSFEDDELGSENFD